MESDEIRETLREAERAAAAPWVDYPRDPAWHALALSVAGPMFVLIGAQLFGALAGRATVIALPSVVLSLLVVLVVTDQRRRRGTWPTGAMPTELRALLPGYIAGAIVLAVVFAGAGALAPAPVPLVLALVLAYGVTFAGVRWYLRAYDRAAARVRERLA